MATQISYPTSNAVVLTGWTNPTNAYASDGVYATCIPPVAGTVSSYFGGFGFDSSIPSTAVINSVTVESTYKVSGGTGTTFGIQPYIGGSAYGAEKTDTTNPTTDKVVTSSVYTGITWTNLNDANFKVLARVSVSGAAPTAPTESLDYVKVTVDYTPPAPTGYPAAVSASPSLGGIRVVTNSSVAVAGLALSIGFGAPVVPQHVSTPLAALSLSPALGGVTFRTLTEVFPAALGISAGLGGVVAHGDAFAYPSAQGAQPALGGLRVTGSANSYPAAPPLSPSLGGVVQTSRLDATVHLAALPLSPALGGVAVQFGTTGFPSALGLNPVLGAVNVPSAVRVALEALTPSLGLGGAIVHQGAKYTSPVLTLSIRLGGVTVLTTAARVPGSGNVSSGVGASSSRLPGSGSVLAGSGVSSSVVPGNGTVSNGSGTSSLGIPGIPS